MTAVIALIDLVCVHLGLERLRVFSLMRPQLPGDAYGIRTRDLRRDSPTF